MDYYVSKKENPGPVIPFSYQNPDLDKEISTRLHREWQRLRKLKRSRSALGVSNSYNCGIGGHRLKGDDKGARHLARQRRDHGHWRRSVKRRTGDHPRGVRMLARLRSALGA